MSYARFEALRNERGLSNYEVAKRAGIGEPVLSRWKNGKNGISLSSALRIAQVLDVSIMDFVDSGEVSARA